MTGTPQVEVLRQPAGPTEAEMLELHRCLFPERHLAHWREQPEADWPHRWDGESTYQWDAGTIEWVAQMIEMSLQSGGLIR
jgi:hypothetical protein